MVKSRKPRVKLKKLRKEKATHKFIKYIEKIFMNVYGGLHRNLRLWTIQELVSSISNNTKAYRLKQEFSRYGYVCPYFE